MKQLGNTFEDVELNSYRQDNFADEFFLEELDSNYSRLLGIINPYTYSEMK